MAPIKATLNNLPCFVAGCDCAHTDRQAFLFILPTILRQNMSIQAFNFPNTSAARLLKRGAVGRRWACWLMLP
jgi:hypothetical protein